MTTATCYHGSSPQDFIWSADHWKAFVNYSLVEIDSNIESASVPKHVAAFEKFYADHVKILEDQQFGRFLFSWCTELYLTKKEDTIPEIVKELLILGLNIRYLDFKFRRESRSHHQDMALSDNYQQRMKYTHDVNAGERGFINCLARKNKGFL
jgi:hypothetical protein